MGATPSRSVLLQYVALALTWGASFLFIKVGLEGLSPAQVVLGRLVLGFLALATIMILTRQHLPTGISVWGHLAVVAVLLCVAPFLLFAWAEEHISSGLASIYNATTPLMTMLIALALLPEERLTRSRVAGLLAGFAGVMIVLGPWRGLGDVDVLAQAACLLATVSYGIALVYLRRFVSPRQLGAVPVATAQVGIGALVMVCLSPAIANQPITLQPNVIASILLLGIVGTGLAYIWSTNIVARWGATNASTVTYWAPVVGVALGATVLGESLSWFQPVGALVVILGIAISQDRLTLTRPGSLAPALRRERRG